MIDQLYLFNNETSAVTKKAVSSHVAIQLDPFSYSDILFQHSVLCQTSLPYRNPKNSTVWHKKQGNSILTIQTHKVPDGEGNLIDHGLPFGTKARLILYYINSMAIKTQRRQIAIGKSFTSFVKRLGLTTDGRTIDTCKDQLVRLKNSSVGLHFTANNVKAQKDHFIIEDYYINLKGNGILNLFSDGSQSIDKDNCIINLGEYYFKSLLEHAVPLDERAISALSNNSRRLDIYTWLANRLWRIEANEPKSITWKALKDQFGDNLKEMHNFKKKFRHDLEVVKLVYPKARIEEIHNKGFELKQSPPPIKSNAISMYTGS